MTIRFSAARFHENLDTMEAPPKRRRVLSKPLPAEGDGGLFSQSWFPICMSREVPTQGVLGTTFLGTPMSGCC